MTSRFKRKSGNSTGPSLGMNQNTLDEITNSTLSRLVGMIAFLVIWFGLLGAWVPVYYSLKYEWHWILLLNAALMTVGAVLAAQGWRSKKDGKVWLGALFLPGSVILCILLKGLFS